MNANDVMKLADTDTLKQQAKLVGDIADSNTLTDQENDLLRGLWEFLHHLLDTVEP